MISGRIEEQTGEHVSTRSIGTHAAWFSIKDDTAECGIICPRCNYGNFPNGTVYWDSCDIPGALSTKELIAIMAGEEE